MTQRNHKLIDGKMNQYLLPSILLTMALQLGGVVDTILVGNLLGTEAMSAVRLCMPIILAEQFVSYGLGVGGSICVGIYLGKRDRDRASAVFSAVFLLTFAVGILFSFCAFFLSDPIAALLSGNGPLRELARQYLFIWLMGGPIIGTGLYLANFMGVEGHPGLSSAYIVLSNGINLVLDYIFLAYTPLGITGAALSTMLGYLLGLAVYIQYFRDKNRMLVFHVPKSLKPLAEAAKAGTPSMIYLTMSFVETLGSNAIILYLLGMDGITIYTVCTNVMMIMLMATGGIIGVIPSLAGVLYGENDFYGLRAMCVRTLKITSAVTLIVLFATMVFTQQVTALFGIRQMPLLGYTIPALRCFMLCLPFYVWNKYLTSYYQSIKQSRYASLITFLQYGVVSMPAAFIGISLALRLGYGGFNALGLSFLFSEVITTLIALLYLRIRHPGKGIFLLPGKNSGDCLDMTIEATPEEAVKASQQVLQFGLEKGVERKLANRMAVAAEEMMINAIKHGGTSSRQIDVCLTAEPERLLLRIRDDGIPFDPTTYAYDDGEYEFRGIEVVKKIASKISYIRAINLNNTVIEIDKEVQDAENEND